MKVDMTPHRGLLSRIFFYPFHAFAAAGLLLSGLCTSTSRADPLIFYRTLLTAPSANGSYYGMYDPYVTAASFTLANSSYVSTIDVILRTPTTTSFTTFHFSLQSALTNPVTVFASQDLTASLGGASTQVMNVNETLPAGTYYLAGIVPGYFGTPATSGNVDGWVLSTGAYYEPAGTIANGVWVGSNPPNFDTGGVYVAPAFTVFGSTVPEPSVWVMLAAGTASLLALRRKHLNAFAIV